jgi:hypothetical protein
MIHRDSISAVLPRNVWLAIPILLTAVAFVRAQSAPPIAIDNANQVATDDLGRTLPSYGEVGEPKPNRWVGLFYFQWHKQLRHEVCYNRTEWLKTHPGFKDWVINPPGGPEHPEWYWAEPLFGYYKSIDRWVIRKHLAMIADAGVDFLFLDCTNLELYDAELSAFLDVASEMKAQGLAVPRLVFFLNTDPEWKIESLYKNWYKPGKHDDMCFRWQGKPLMLAVKPADGAKFKNPELFREIQDYFTWRPMWDFYDKDPSKWRYIDRHPQRPARTADGRIEQLVVAKSLGGPIWDQMENGGVSSVPGKKPRYNDQWLTAESPRGLFFEEQWKVAREVAPPIVLVTGWNEWMAAVWEQPGVIFLGRKTVKGQGYFVDSFNMDFNRDLEPMKGGYGDNYYWQFVANMRRYKGMRPPQAVSALQTVAIDGQFAEWRGVQPNYRDTAADTANRDCDGTVEGLHYTDRSARNDLVEARVARDEKTLFFYIRAAGPLTPPEGNQWMTLLVDADANAATGWHGYDYLINRNRQDDQCTVERNREGTWQWEKVADVHVRWAGNELELAVPRTALGMEKAKGSKFDFKWTDNLPDPPDIMDFFGKGDVAPNARFNYRYEEAQTRRDGSSLSVPKGR